MGRSNTFSMDPDSLREDNRALSEDVRAARSQRLLQPPRVPAGRPARPGRAYPPSRGRKSCARVAKQN